MPDIQPDLVRRLRLVADERKASYGHPGVCQEAADAIKALREALEAYVADCTNEECEFCIRGRTALALACGGAA